MHALHSVSVLTLCANIPTLTSVELGKPSTESASEDRGR